MTQEPFDLSPSGAGKLIGVSGQAVLTWAKAGQLPHLRTPGGRFRFRRSDVEAWVRRHTRGGGAAA